MQLRRGGEKFGCVQPSCSYGGGRFFVRARTCYGLCAGRWVFVGSHVWKK